MRARWIRVLWTVASLAVVAGASVAIAVTAQAAAFGFTTSGGRITVDSGAGMTFTVTQASGELTSLTYNGTELQWQTKSSHIQSGIGAATTAALNGDYVVVTEVTHAWRGTGTLIQYLVCHKGDNAVYMATWLDDKGPGELRWITYLDRGVLPNRTRNSDIAGNSGAIESSDVFQVGAETRSKYYNKQRAIDYAPLGVTGNGVGVYLDFGNRESSSGGPFFRDIQEQGTDGATELYNYMWSGHNDPEAERMNALHGPYALVVTNGSAPAARDMSFMYGLGLQGAVPASGRGTVTGTATGATAPVSVGWANGTAQYWARPDSSGRFTSPAMKPGSYTQTLYQGELAVATKSVTVSAGVTATSNIASTFTLPSSVLFRIGAWDGTPAAFRNADKVTLMHPSDARMSSWGPQTFTWGSSSSGDFPAYQWQNVNNPTTVRFTLSASQVAARTVRIGITAAFANGRPRITVNNWTSAIPSPSAQPDSRSLTIGTYRGNNALFSYPVPASALVAGTNTLSIAVVSGSGSGTFLSAGVSYDSVEMY
jgi:rhamnogalacturonan endolyase